MVESSFSAGVEGVPFSFVWRLNCLCSLDWLQFSICRGLGKWSIGSAGALGLFSSLLQEACIAFVGFRIGIGTVSVHPHVTP